MAASRTEAASRARWAGTTPEQRQAGTKKARLSLAVREIVENWPELTAEQQQRLRALLVPLNQADAVLGGGQDGR